MLLAFIYIGKHLKLNNISLMRNLTKRIYIMLICSLAYLNGQAAVDPATVQSAISVLTVKDNGNKAGIE